MNATIVTFAGNLAADPELRFTTSGKPVTEFRVIVNRRTRTTGPDGGPGEWTDAEPTAHSCKLWGPEAENLVESITRGQRVIVTGHIETEAWNDRETHEKRHRDVVNVDEVGTSLKYATAKPTKTTRNTNTTNSTNSTSGASETNGTRS